MWARICEMILGLWLIVSYFIFPTGSLHDLCAAILILLFAALSYIPSLNKIHLLQVLPAAYLLSLGYSYPTPILPFGLQNYILIALTLLMFALIPSNASDHPRPWKKFLKERQK